MPLPLLSQATELLIDDILPLLAVRDIVALASTSKAFKALLLDTDSPDAELLWKRRIKQDLRFPVQSTARQHGWLGLYRKIRQPHMYLWGEAKNGRLAITRSDPRVPLLTRSGGLPVPARLDLGVPVVDLVAGGWSFHALSVSGEVWHWGQLDGGAFAPPRLAASPVPLHAHPGSVIVAPIKLAPQLPPIQRILAGRRHALALDEEGHLWTWANWADAGRLRADWLGDHVHVKDMAAGWEMSAVLVEARKSTSNPRRTAAPEQHVWVWWQRFNSPSLRTVETLGQVPERVGRRDGCYHFTPSQAVRLPSLPAIPHADRDRGESDVPERIVKLAAGDAFIVALSTEGRVYKINVSVPPLIPHHLQDDDDVVEEGERDPEDGTIRSRQFAELEALLASGRRTWEYLPRFSEPDRWQAATSPPQTGRACNEQDKAADPAKEGPRITFISASFRTFFAIGEGVVLQGSSDTSAESGPTRMPALQNRGVIRVESGDYHYGALTAAGELLTWGAYSNGALGHGHSYARLADRLSPEDQRFNRPLATPHPVDFYNPLLHPGGNAAHAKTQENREFVFNVAFAGWQSSALTVNLSDDESSQVEADKASGTSSGPAPSDDADMDEQPETFKPEHSGDVEHAAAPQAQRAFLPGIFRVGYAGRGAYRGGRGRGDAV